MSSLEILEECLHRIYICRRKISDEKGRISALKSGKSKHPKSVESPSSSLKSTDQTGRNDIAESSDISSYNDITNYKKNTKKTIMIGSSNSNSFDSNYDTDNNTINSNLTSSNTTKITTKGESTNIDITPIMVKNVIDLTLNDQTATVVFDEFRTGNI